MANIRGTVRTVMNWRKMMNKKRELFLDVLWSFHGTWYSWGGDDPEGFDCSGLVVEGLKSVGVIERGTDYTAQGLFNMFREVGEASSGVLAFWGTGEKVLHVEVCIDEEHCIGASGGGSATSSKADAIRANAFVKIRPIERGREFVGYADPFYGDKYPI